MGARIPFRRRTFLVKQEFQLRWALYPLLILAVFLLAAGVYLDREVTGALRFELYRPHSRVENTWALVRPAVARVVAVGGGAALMVLGFWGAAWTRRLRRDLDALTKWMEEVAEGKGGPPPSFREPEVRALAESLARAAEGFKGWDRDMTRSWEALARELGGADPGDLDRLRTALPRIQEAATRLHRVWGRLRIDEGVS